MKIKKFLMLFAIVVLLLLTGCGENNSHGVSKKQLTSDLEAYDAFAEVNATITDINIITRRTRAAEMMDYIYAEITSENEYFLFKHTYEINYELYDNGWVMGDILLVSESHDLLYPDECYADEKTVKEGAEKWIPESMSSQDWNMRNIEITSLNLNTFVAESKQPYCIYDFTATAECDYADFEISGCILYTLTPWNGWKYDAENESTQITFKIIEKITPSTEDIFANAEEMLYFEYDIKEYNLRNIRSSEPELIKREEITPLTYAYGIETFYADKYGIKYTYSVVYTAENDDAAFEVECIEEYFLMSKDGWEYIGAYTAGDPTVKPKSAPSRDTVDSAISSLYSGNVQFVSENWEGDTYSATYNVTDSSTYKYVINYYNVTLRFEFYPMIGWIYIDSERSLSKREFDVLGTWTYEDDDDNRYIIDITSMTHDTVSFSYDMKVHYYFSIGGAIKYASSNGEVTQREWNTTSNSYIALETTKHIVGWQYVDFGTQTKLYYLEFRSYRGNEYDKSGFYIDGKQLTRS